MPLLGEKLTLLELQKYVQKMEEERGFAQNTLLHQCLLLGEELGELCETFLQENPDPTRVKGELADILIFILSIANRLNVDLEKTFSKKAQKSPNLPFLEYQHSSFDKKSLAIKALTLVAETGKLFKTVRKSLKLKIDFKSTFCEDSEKLSDILYMLCCIGNSLNIDLEQAFKEKEELNKHRNWN